MRLLPGPNVREDGEFIWLDAQGMPRDPRRMSTDHLMNCVAMLLRKAALPWLPSHECFADELYGPCYGCEENRERERAFERIEYGLAVLSEALTKRLG